MAAAALVCPDRLDKPSLMLAGQPEKEVSEPGHLTLAADETKYMLASLDLHLIMKMVSYPPQCDRITASRVSFKMISWLRDGLSVRFSGKVSHIKDVCWSSLSSLHFLVSDCHF